MRWLSIGLDTLLAREDAEQPFDVIVVGSGYGGSVAALRYAQAGLRVAVLERGREWTPGEFPNDVAQLPGQLRLDRPGRPLAGADDGLFDIRMHRGATMVLGNALGGGSQVNANVALRADPEVFADPRWPSALRNVRDPLDGWYSRAEDMLGVSPYPHPSPKADALERIAAPLQKQARKREWTDGPAPTVRFYRPPLAVNNIDGTDRFGVVQPACNGCGDCVTGCNVGAKNVLTANYLPLARRHGATLVTGVNVVAVQPSAGDDLEPQPGQAPALATVWVHPTGDDWCERLSERRGVDIGTLERMGLVALRARRIVVAAGSLGSTEILLRSRQLGLLDPSPRLGAGFSGNGDGLAFAYDQDDPVRAIGWGSDPQRLADGRPPGPTIVGAVDLRAGLPVSQGRLIEDGILPGALVHFAHEMVTTVAALERLGRWHTRADDGTRDPLALDPDALRRTQVWLWIGHDEANGSLALEHGRVVATMPAMSTSPTFARQAQDVACAAGAVNATGLANPVSNPLPRSLGALLDGAPLDGNRMVVHALGGCAMGDQWQDAVVDDRGLVYSGRTARAVHRSLQVLDGAIMPTSLGANPFLTIAALAERAVALSVGTLPPAYPAASAASAASVAPAPAGSAPVAIAAASAARVAPTAAPSSVAHTPPSATPSPATATASVPSPQPSTSSRSLPPLPPLPAPPQPPFANPGAGVAAITLTETMRGHLDVASSGTSERYATALSVRLHVPDMLAMLASPQHLVDRIGGELRLMRERPATAAHPPASALPDALTLTVVGGHVEMLSREPGPAFRRTLDALGVWWRKRGRDEVLEALRDALQGKGGASGLDPRQWWSRAKVLVDYAVALAKLARRVAEPRRFLYDLELEDPQGQRWTLAGRKDIRYGDDVNPWRSLLELQTEVRRSDGALPALNGKLCFDIVDFADHGAPQIGGTVDTPNGLMALASLPLFFLRTVLTVYPWDLRLPDYPPRNRHAPLGDQRPLLVDRIYHAPSGSWLVGERHRFMVPWKPPERSQGVVAAELPGDGDPEQIELMLTRISPPAGYRPDPSLGADGRRCPLLMMAGFAQSAAAFVAEPLDEDLVRHFLNRNFEVWLFDYRTSTALPSARLQCLLDDVAAVDIPFAVHKIREVTGVDKVLAFGHCMGSATLAMSLLSGAFARYPQHGCPDRDDPPIRGLVLSQVPPYLVGGTYSQGRRQLAPLFRDVLGIDVLDLAADDGALGWESMLDRVLATLPVGEDDCVRARDVPRWNNHCATCRRVSGIIGPLYRHANMQRVHPILDRYFGIAAVSVFAQIVKFFEYECLVSARDVVNYVSDPAVEYGLAMPVAFLHGELNEVFDVESAQRSFEQLVRIHGNSGEGPRRRELFRIPGYAHFDCVVGDRAHIDVFPKLSEFLARWVP